MTINLECQNIKKIVSKFPQIHSDEWTWDAGAPILPPMRDYKSLPSTLGSIFRCLASLIFLTYITLHSSYHNCSSSLTTLLRTMYTLHYNRKEKKTKKKSMGTSVNPSRILSSFFRIFWNNFSMGRKTLKQWTLYEQSKVY